MRSTVDLAQQPYTFAVNRLLLPDKFLSELRDRGMHLSRDRLEALHQTRLLVPLLRLRRDSREIAVAFRRDPNDAYRLAHWQPTSREDIDEAARNGRLYDPAAERFMSRRPLQRPLGDLSYDASVYLYSPQQLIHAPTIREALPSLSLRGREGARLVSVLNTHEAWRDRWRRESARLREIATAVVALEPLYYSQVLGVLRLDTGWAADVHADVDRYYAWRTKLPLGRMLRWLGINARWLEQASATLLRLSDRNDPLGAWAELVPYASPEAWTKLHGQARTAVDLRVAAEVLLRYHDELVAAGRTKQLLTPPPRTASPFDSRLQRRRPLDAVLTDLGLSPHPRVVLVVEGATERLIFRRVMAFYGIRTEEDFISIQDAGGAGRALEPLVAFVAPRLGERQQERYVELLRPPTPVLVVLDPEPPVATAEDLEKRRQVWVERLMAELPRELVRDENTGPVLREQLDLLVAARTWKRTGESFEFAHFTDRQIAHAVDRLDRRGRKPTLKRLTELIAQTRTRRGNLDAHLHGASKLDLADELWPVLERRLERAERRRTDAARRIPIVRVLDQALDLAGKFGHGQIVLALEPSPRGGSRRRRRRT